MRWTWLSLLLISSAWAAQTSVADDPKALLLEVRKKVMLTLNSLPKYMCTETVERSILEPVRTIGGPSCDDIASQKKRAGWKVRRTAADRLRLDVAISGGSEMFSWVGEERFQDRSLAALVGGGATSTGAFATFLGSIFGTNDARFTYNRDPARAGSSLAEFGFLMPLDKSHYSVANKMHSAVVAYEGTFLVDTTTFRLVHLTVRPLQVPAELGVCEDITTLDYEAVQLHGSEFLLPKNARFDVTAANGKELDNRTTFSGCHEFHGESTLQFGDVVGTEQQAVAKAEARVVNIPAGLTFTMALTQPIPVATSAAGDVVRAKLTSGIRDKSKTLLAAKNTAVLGRILQIERMYGVGAQPAESVRVGIKLEGIEIDGIVHPFFAELHTVENDPIQSAAGFGHGRRGVRGNDGLGTRQNLGTFDQTYSVDESGVGYLFYYDVTEDFTIRPGVEMTGKTATGPRAKIP